MNLFSDYTNGFNGLNYGMVSVVSVLVISVLCKLNGTHSPVVSSGLSSETL